MRSAPIVNPQSLGGVLREARLGRGLTQRQLAHELDIDQEYIVHLEAGKPTKAMTRLFDFMRETGVTLYAELADD